MAVLYHLYPPEYRSETERARELPMEIPSSSLVFTVERSEPELIPPSHPTPYEFKYLSDLDDQKPLRKNNFNIQFYRKSERMEGTDPVKVIKEAVAKTLVHYYPFAGRLLEGSNGKLVVECNGKGVLFIEANASVSLDQFGDVLNPPFPGVGDLLYDVPGSGGVLHCPLLLIQVTRLRCGGFVFAIRINHTMCDGSGILQFMMAVGEMARGGRMPSIEPVWKRELLTARDPPKVSRSHHVYDQLSSVDGIPIQDKSQMVKRSFFFSLEEIAKLKKHMPTNLQMCSKVEVLVACLWQCRTIAFGLDFENETRLALSTNARAKFNPPLPAGYYGNAFGKPVAITTARELCRKPLAYAVELIQRAKAEVTEEFMRSTLDLLAATKPPSFETELTFHVSDLTKMRFVDVDFGWGKAAYGGPIWGGHPSSFLVSSKYKGEDGIVVTIDLPKASTGNFAAVVERVIRSNTRSCSATPTSAL